MDVKVDDTNIERMTVRGPKPLTTVEYLKENIPNSEFLSNLRTSEDDRKILFEKGLGMANKLQAERKCPLFKSPCIGSKCAWGVIEAIPIYENTHVSEILPEGFSKLVAYDVKVTCAMLKIVK